MLALLLSGGKGIHAIRIVSRTQWLHRSFSVLTWPIVLDLGKVVKDAVQKQGMLGWQYSPPGVSDGITMGGEGSSPDTTEDFD